MKRRTGPAFLGASSRTPAPESEQEQRLTGYRGCVRKAQSLPEIYKYITPRRE